MTQVVAATHATPVVELIPLGKIHESKSNTRKTFRGIEELAEDIKARGVLQPVLVRPNADGYEIVFGARRFRAAKLAKLAALPAFIRELSDEQTLELQIVENSQREDVHPLEEADGYRRLHEEFKYSVEEIAAKVGKSRSAVYERIKLCALVPAAREAFLAGKLSASTALLVARIPDKELQAKAVKDIAGGPKDVDPMSYRAAVEHVQRNYMLQLKDAPFDTTDAALVARAGACSACPKRTGNQRELFADVKSPDVCTDPVCYRGKVDALWQLKVAKAKETGQEVIEGKEAKKLFPQGGEYLFSSEFKKLDDKEWVGRELKSVKSIVGKDVPTTLVRTPAGDVVELVKAAAVREKLKEKHAEHKPSKTLAAQQEKFRKENEKHARQVAQEGAIRKAVFAAVVAKAEKADPKPNAWKFLAACIGYDHAEQVAERRGWLALPDEDERSGDAIIETEIAKLTADQARGFVVEVVTTLTYSRSLIDQAKLAAQAFGVDYDKLAAAATGRAPKAIRGTSATADKKRAIAGKKSSKAAPKKKPAARAKKPAKAKKPSKKK